MPLLTKQEVQKSLSAERKMAIDEGIAMARKVDGLRQTALKEEASLHTFRNGVTAETLEEIATLLKKKATLENEIKERIEERDRVMEPLQRKEADVDKKLESLSVKQEDIGVREEALVAKERISDKKALDLLNADARIADMEKRARQSLQDASTVLNDSHAFEKTVNMKYQAVVDSEKKGTELLSQREESVVSRERRADERDDKQDKRELELNNKERRVMDLYQTLERNQKRNG